MVLVSIYRVLIFCLLCSVLFYACKDSLGIEPNPKITYIDKPPLKSNKYRLETMNITISEKYKFIETYFWDTNYTVLAYDIYIDTTNQLPFLWFNLNLKSSKTTPGFPRRNDWISQVEFRVDSVNPIGTILLNEPVYKNRSYRVFIYEYVNDKIYYFTENQATALLKFYEFETVKKNISGAFEITFFATSPFETNSLIVFFRINY